MLESPAYVRVGNERIGWDAGCIQDNTQNRVHHYLSDSPYFPVPNYSKFFYENSRPRPFTLYTY